MTEPSSYSPVPVLYPAFLQSSSSMASGGHDKLFNCDSTVGGAHPDYVILGHNQIPSVEKIVSNPALLRAWKDRNYVFDANLLALAQKKQAELIADLKMQLAEAETGLYNIRMEIEANGYTLPPQFMSELLTIAATNNGASNSGK